MTDVGVAVMAVPVQASEARSDEASSMSSIPVGELALGKLHFTDPASIIGAGKSSGTQGERPKRYSMRRERPSVSGSASGSSIYGIGSSPCREGIIERKIFSDVEEVLNLGRSDLQKEADDIFRWWCPGERAGGRIDGEPGGGSGGKGKRVCAGGGESK